MRKPKKPRRGKARPAKAPGPAVKIRYDLTDPVEHQLFYNALEKGYGSKSALIKKLGLGYATYYRREKSDPAFKAGIQEMIEEIRPKIVDRVIELATKGDRYLLMQLARAYFPEFRPNSLVNVNVPGGSPEPVDPNLKEFAMTEAGNKLAHEMLLKYMEWREAKGLALTFTPDGTFIKSDETTPERPLPQDGDAEKLEHRKGLKLVEGKKDEDKD